MAPTACKRMVSGSISLSCSEYFSPFPHGTCSLSVSLEYLALPDGPGRFRQNFTCSVLLRILLDDKFISYTGLSPSMVVLSRFILLKRRFVTPCSLLRYELVVLQPLYDIGSQSTKPYRFRLFPVRSPLLGESQLMYFPQDT